MNRTLKACLLVSVFAVLGGCALFSPRDPLTVNVVGIDPLPSEGLELRMAVKLRIQNPNDSTLEYNGAALELEVNGRPFASGVSDVQGSVGRYSETVLSVPISVSAFSALRQALGLTQNQTLEQLPYVLRGKLAGGLFGTMRFKESGTLDLSPVRLQ